MSNSKDILVISNSIQYFQQAFSSGLQSRQLQSHLNTLQTTFHKANIIEQSPSSFLLNLLAILSQRYYELSTGKQILLQEEYLINKFIAFIEYLYQQTIYKKVSFKKDLLVVLLWATVSQIKKAFIDHEKCSDLKTTLLNFNLALLQHIFKMGQAKISEIYPKEYSVCSLLLRNQSISLKHFVITLQTMKVLIAKNVIFKRHDQGHQSMSFRIESHKRLIDDIKFLIHSQNRYNISFSQKIRIFSEFLLANVRQNGSQLMSANFDVGPLVTNNGQGLDISTLKTELFIQTILLAQMSELPIQLQQYGLYEKNIIEQSYKQIYLSGCKVLMKIDIDFEGKFRELTKLTYIISFVHLAYADGDQLTQATIKLIKHVFSIKNSHKLITIPHHATTIPIERLKPTHSNGSYCVDTLQLQYLSQFSRMQMQVVPFYQLQLRLVDLVQKLFVRMNNTSRNALLKYFSDEFQQFEYNIDMSITSLYSYLENVLILRSIINTTSSISITENSASFLYTVFQIFVNRTESVKILTASFIEQEILIAISLQIIFNAYKELKSRYLKSTDLRNKIKLTQNSVRLIETILNSFTEQSYLIRLITTILLINFAQEQTIEKALNPIQTTIIHRNKNNLHLIKALLQLTTMTKTDYEELANYYLSHTNCELLLRFLLPRIQIESCRKCILTVEKWWILLNRETIEWLNCKQMKRGQDKAQNFYTQDSENVVIKNALGVIVIELGQKWVYYLKNQKKEVIIDVILDLLQVNYNLVFFRGFFTHIILQCHHILRETLGFEREDLQITCRKNRKQNDMKQQNAVAATKVQFYDRLRYKIYKLMIILPVDNFKLWDKANILKIKSLILSRHEQVKKSYLFDGNCSLKQQYELGKQCQNRFETVQIE